VEGVLEDGGDGAVVLGGGDQDRVGFGDGALQSCDLLGVACGFEVAVVERDLSKVDVVDPDVVGHKLAGCLDQRLVQGSLAKAA